MLPCIDVGVCGDLRFKECSYIDVGGGTIHKHEVECRKIAYMMETVKKYIR
jgi:hypothetical protein